MAADLGEKYRYYFEHNHWTEEHHSDRIFITWYMDIPEWDALPEHIQIYYRELLSQGYELTSLSLGGSLIVKN